MPQRSNEAVHHASAPDDPRQPILRCDKSIECVELPHDLAMCPAVLAQQSGYLRACITCEGFECGDHTEIVGRRASGPGQ